MNGILCACFVIFMYGFARSMPSLREVSSLRMRGDRIDSAERIVVSRQLRLGERCHVCVEKDTALHQTRDVVRGRVTFDSCSTARKSAWRPVDRDITYLSLLFTVCVCH